MFIRRELVLVAMLLTCLSNTVSARSTRPHIIVVLADDLGWNDVSFHGSNQFHTPNIDALAYNGIILNSHYVPALCTPSRASLLTGKYPTSIGMQHLVILAPEPWGLPLEETLMPQHFKRHGYATHAIGKWHLGFYKKEYTPTYRGFDTHFGYWNGFHDYYDHMMHADTLKGYDMRRGLDVDYSSEGLYSTDVFNNEAVKIIENHNSTQGPLFLYLSHLAPHAGNPDNPFQAPEEEVSKHDHIQDPARRIYAAMVTKLDDSLGKVVSALKRADMLDNSIILFLSDNGAATYGLHSNRGSNYPLRGLKESPWEGGVRGAAVVWSPLLNRTRRVSNQLMHVSDWLPTLYSAAGLDASELGPIDGMDLWPALSNGDESPRKEVFNNYDEIDEYASLMVDSWKLIEGTLQEGIADYWFGETGRDEHLTYDVSKVLESETNQVLSRYLAERINNTRWGQVPEYRSPVSAETILALRRESIVTCDYPTFSTYDLLPENHTMEGESSPRSFSDIIQVRQMKTDIVHELESIYRRHPFDESVDRTDFRFSSGDRARIERLVERGDLRYALSCDPTTSRPCLYNLKTDPCERVNLADVYPAVLEALRARLTDLKKTVVKPLNRADDPFSNPDFHNGTWASWRDRDDEVPAGKTLDDLTDDDMSSAFVAVLLENVFRTGPGYSRYLLPGTEPVLKNGWSLCALGLVTVLLITGTVRRFGRTRKS